jgi:hypothetical protein
VTYCLGSGWWRRGRLWEDCRAEMLRWIWLPFIGDGREQERHVMRWIAGCWPDTGIIWPWELTRDDGGAQVNVRHWRHRVNWWRIEWATCFHYE